MESTVTSTFQSIALEFDIALIEYKTVEVEPVAVNSFSFNSLRWVILDQLLKHNNNYLKTSFDKVLLVNVHNTAFHGNPFASVTDTKNVFFAYQDRSPAPDTTIGVNLNINKSITDCFGSEMAALLQYYNLLTIDMSLGTMDIVSDYIEKMTKILIGQSVLGKNYPSCESKYSDSGIHNVLLYADVLMNTMIKKKDSFPVVDIKTYPGFWPLSGNF